MRILNDAKLESGQSHFLFCFGALRNKRRLLPLNLVSLNWFKELINQSIWIGFNFSITFQVSESAMTAVTFFFFFDRLNQVYCVRVWMGVRGRSRLYQFFFSPGEGEAITRGKGITRGTTIFLGNTILYVLTSTKLSKYLEKQGKDNNLKEYQCNYFSF